VTQLKEVSSGRRFRHTESERAPVFQRSVIQPRINISDTLGSVAARLPRDSIVVGRHSAELIRGNFCNSSSSSSADAEPARSFSSSVHLLADDWRAIRSLSRARQKYTIRQQNYHCARAEKKDQTTECEL